MLLRLHACFPPHKLQEINPSCSDVDSLSALPFFQSPALTALKNEFLQYIAAAENVSSEYSPLDFWKNHETTLPAWAEAAKKVLLVQPSSAAAERIFSLLKCSFGEQQLSALEANVTQRIFELVKKKSRSHEYNYLIISIIKNVDCARARVPRLARARY